MGDLQAGGAVWGRWALSALLLAGIGISAVLTQHHENKVYGDASVVLSNCPETETVNCDTVNTSAWSELLGIPIAAFAIPTYLVVLALLWRRQDASACLAYAFCIGLLTTLYSVALLYISSTKIGFICLYCASLYGVNVSIPLLTALIARTSPAALMRRALADLASRPRALKLTGVTFVALLAATVALQQAYRVHVRKVAAAEQERIEREGGPLVPAGPSSDAAPGAVAPPPPASAGLYAATAETVPAPAVDASQGGSYQLAGPLRRIEKGAKVGAFDLQARLGGGKPAALLFWYPGDRLSERTLVSMVQFMRKEVPSIDLFAVSAKGEDSRDEEILESATMLGLPADLTLLIDDKGVVSAALNTLDIPDVSLFDGKGKLVIAKIKALGQKLVVPPETLTAEEVMRRVAAGKEVAEIKQMAQYYPATELYGQCAPAFQARNFGSGSMDSFTGKPAGGKPTLLMFWSATCKHCQVEVPLLVDWVKRNPGRLDIVSVTRLKADKPGQDHRETTARYIKDKEIPWTVLEDPDGAITEIYRTISTPTSFFITARGNVVSAWFYPHPSGFDKAMEDALARVKTSDSIDCRPAMETPAPRMALEMLGPDGRQVSLASQLDRPALVHLWATWCAPCVEEIPGLVKFGQKIASEGEGRLIMVSVEDAAAREKISGFGKKLGIDLRSALSPTGGLASALDLAYRLPRTYFVAPGGVVLGSRQGNQNWDDPQLAERVLSRLRNAASLAR